MEIELEALIKYLSDLLSHRGHFNIDDELAVGNIEKRHKSLQNSIKNNPYLNKKEQAHADADSLCESINLLIDIDEGTHKRLIDEYEILLSYEQLWDSNLRGHAKNKRGSKRQELHKELFLEQIGGLLKNKSPSFTINNSLNICYLDNGNTVFPDTFIEIIETIETINSHTGSLFFRGHENSSYRLIPSIYRGNAPFFEKELLYDAINLLPEEVRGAHSNFEILTKLQHFGTPTRLLDITTNPLVALYFACMNGTNHGEVLCFNVSTEKIKLFDSDTVSILANLSKMPYDFNTRKIGGKTLEDFNKESQIMELVHKIRNEKSYFDNIIQEKDLKKSFFVTSKLDNPRIIRQSGAFIICGMDNVKLSPSPEIYDFERNTSKRIIVSRSLKKAALMSLDIFNISSGSLFPDLSEVSRYIKNKYNLSTNT